MNMAHPSQSVHHDDSDGRATGGENRLAMSGRMVEVERLIGSRVARRQPLAAASALLTGILFAVGRRTVTSWVRAVGVSDDLQDYYLQRCRCVRPSRPEESLQRWGLHRTHMLDTALHGSVLEDAVRPMTSQLGHTPKLGRHRGVGV